MYFPYYYIKQLFTYNTNLFGLFKMLYLLNHRLDRDVLDDHERLPQGAVDVEVNAAGS